MPSIKGSPSSNITKNKISNKQKIPKSVTILNIDEIKEIAKQDPYVYVGDESSLSGYSSDSWMDFDSNLKMDGYQPTTSGGDETKSNHSKSQSIESNSKNNQLKKAPEKLFSGIEYIQNDYPVWGEVDLGPISLQRIPSLNMMPLEETKKKEGIKLDQKPSPKASGTRLTQKNETTNSFDNFINAGMTRNVSSNLSSSPSLSWMQRVFSNTNLSGSTIGYDIDSDDAPGTPKSSNRSNRNSQSKFTERYISKSLSAPGKLR
jgi:hypothetical protein